MSGWKSSEEFFRIELLLKSVKEPIEKIKNATERVEAATDVGNAQPMEVRIERPGVAEQVLTGTPAIMASIGIVIMLLYFLLGLRREVSYARRSKPYRP